MNNFIDLSIVIPCYNEEKNLPLLISKCAPLAQHDHIEVIFVNNGSTDGSAKVFADILGNYQNFFCVSVEENQGYGHGILAGLEQARGRILSWTHADLQCDPLDIIIGYDYFKGNNTNIFVKGSRYGRPIADVFFTFGMSVFESILLRTKLWDINAQPTMFNKSFYDSLSNPPKDFSLDLFVYYHAKKVNSLVYRFPVLFGKRAFGSSHWNVDWRSKWRFIKRTVNFSLQLRKRF